MVHAKIPQKIAEYRLYRLIVTWIMVHISLIVQNLLSTKWIGQLLSKIVWIIVQGDCLIIQF